MKKLIVQFTFIVLAVSMVFISSVSAATINAASCSQAHVQAAINSATTGDSVVVPSGNCTWTAGISIPNNKKLVITGSGRSSTVITVNPVGTVAVWLGLSGSRVTAMGFVNAPIYANGNNFRIDHCDLTFATWTDGIITGSRDVNPAAIVKGVIDNNTLTNMRILVNGTNYMLSENNAQGGLWTSALNLGSDEAVYIEDNTFAPGRGSINAVDGNYGGRFVFRYNTLNGLQIEAHSVQGNNRAIRKWEVYGNIINNTGSNIYYPFRLRGGTGVILYNSVIGNWTNDGIALDNVGSYDNVGDGGLCNGSSSWDGNEDATGYPCRDQIGRGYDTVLWSNSPVGAYAQPLMPAYGAVNRTESNTEVPFAVINSSGNHIKANRDYYGYNAAFTGTTGIGAGTFASRPATCTTGTGYWATNQSTSSLTGLVGASPSTPISGTLYKCTATNTWTSYYTPYTYPHPLRKLQQQPPPPKNLKISN